MAKYEDLPYELRRMIMRWISRNRMHKRITAFDEIWNNDLACLLYVSSDMMCVCGKNYILHFSGINKEDEARKFKMFKHFPTPMYLPLTPRMRLKRPEIVAVCEY